MPDPLSEAAREVFMEATGGDIEKAKKMSDKLSETDLAALMECLTRFMDHMERQVEWWKNHDANRTETKEE